jgi:hypothetical protein
MLHILIGRVVGWIPRHHQLVITSLQEENRILHSLSRSTITSGIIKVSTISGSSWKGQLVAKQGQ